MRKHFWIPTFLLVVLTALLYFSVSSTRASAERLPISTSDKKLRPIDEKIFTTEAVNVIAASENRATAYVAQTTEDCGDFTPCYVNTTGDGLNGIGTGLRDAIVALNHGDEIVILKDYAIKSHTVLVDKNLTIRGHDNAMISYIGTTCSNPMLLMTSGGIINNLIINDGNCQSPSRNLIEVNSAADVIIKNNTLINGQRAVQIHDHTGSVSVAFNRIENNQNYAVFQESGIETSQVNIYGNNIINNDTSYQVNCNDRGSANHNFWGEGVSAAKSALYCTIDNGKQLGAPILLSPQGAGVEAIRQTVTETMTFAFNGKIGVRRTAGEDYDLIIVNHGRGSESNIPFFETGSGLIEPCSNFYDVFLAEDAAASNLVLSLKYDLNSNCINTIESTEYCAQSDSTKYPLWWYDPANNVTDGWDRTGQNPGGSGAGGAAGQTTACLTNDKEISVTIDNSGRPGISLDLNYTPFVVGLPISEGIKLSQFTAQFDGSKVNLKWISTSENNVLGFYVLRSNNETGTYSRISSLINAIGDTYIGGIYTYTDTDISFTQNYYYKIEVINNVGVSIESHGPVSVLTATATPTATVTRTPFPTRTATPYYYRSPTTYYRPRTSTPSGGPTQVRTYGPSPTGTTTFSVKPTYDPESGYPINQEPTSTTSTTSGYPAPGGNDDLLPTFTPSPIGGTSTDIPEETATLATPQNGENGSMDTQQMRWLFLWVGVASGLSLLGATSIILAKSRFP